MHQLLSSVLLLGVGACSVSAGSGNDAVVNAILDGVRIAVADVEIVGYGGASKINASNIAVDGMTAEVSNVTASSGIVTASVSAVNASAELIVSFFGSSYRVATDVVVSNVLLVANLSNPEETLAAADATQLDVLNLELTLSHTCVEGILCELIMAVGYGYLAETEWIHVMIEDMVTPLLGNLSLAAAMTSHPEPKAVAAESEKMFAEVPDLVNLGSSVMSQGVSLVVNGVYGVQQEDGNTALGQMLRHFFPTLDVVVGTTFAVYSGDENITMGSLSVGVDTISVTDSAVPSLALEFIEDYSMALTMTLSGVKGKVNGSLVVTDKPNGNADYAGAMVAEMTDGSVRLNVSVMVVANETQYGTLPLGSLFYPNLGDGLTAEELMVQLVRRAMPQQAAGNESVGLITQLAQELLLGNPEIASVVSCWVQYPLLALQVSTVSVEVLAFEVGQVTIDGEDVGMVPVVADIARQFLMNGVNYLVHTLVEDVQTEVNTLLQYMTYTSGENPCSTSYAMPEPVEEYNYTANSVMEVIDALVNTYIGTEGPWSVNAYLDAIAQLDLVGSLYYSYEEAFDFGEMALELSNFGVVKVADQEWFNSLAVLKAKNATVLRNELGLGGVGLSMDVAFSMLTDGASSPFSNKLQVTVSLQSVVALIDLLAEFSLPRLMTTPLGYLVTLETGCLLGSLEQVRVPTAQFALMDALSSFVMDAQCINCLSPGFKELHSTMTTVEGMAAMTYLMQYALSFVEGAVNTDVVTQMMDYAVSASEVQCTAVVQGSVAGEAASAVTGASGTSAASGVWTATETTVPAPAAYAEDDGEGPMTNGKALAIMYSITGAIALAFAAHAVWSLAKFDRENAATEDLPLILHPSISGWIRWGVPVFILANVAVLVTANLLYGAGVSALVVVGGTEMSMDDLFTYALGTTVRDMWNAEVYFLAIIIGVFSGIWPYAKLAALVWGWVLPPSALSGKRRGYMFLFMDYMGKWSLLDTMLMLMMMVAFRMHFVLPAMPFLPATFFSFDLIVVPGWGVYGFLLASIMSLAVNHLMVITDRNAQEYNETKGASSNWFDDVDVVRADERVVLATHGWANATPEQSKMRTGGVIVMLVLSLVLLILGATIKTFEFEFDGLAAYALEMSEPGSEKESFSLLGLASGVTKQHDVQDNDFGLWYIAVTFVLFTFVTPLVQTLALIALWLVPLTLKEQKYFLFFNEIIAAWCAPEVFIFTLVCTLVQISQFSEYMVDEQCAYFDFLMKAYVQPMGFLQEYKPTCFRAEAKLLAGCWVSFAAALISIGTYLISWYAAAGVIRHRHSLHEENTCENEPIQENEGTKEVPVVPCADEVPNESLSAPPEKSQ